MTDLERLDLNDGDIVVWYLPEGRDATKEEVVGLKNAINRRNPDADTTLLVLPHGHTLATVDETHMATQGWVRPPRAPEPEESDHDAQDDDEGEGEEVSPA